MLTFCLLNHSCISVKVELSILLYLSILLFKGLPLFGFLIFQFKNTPTPLYLCRDKTKGYSGKNATLSTYKLDSFFKKKSTYKLDSQNKNTGFFFFAKKQGHFTVNFQITLLNYKLDFQNKNMIFFKLKKKKHDRTREARVMRLVDYK